MSSARDAFGALLPQRYHTSSARCSHGESCVRGGCGRPSVRYYRTPLVAGCCEQPSIVGRCAIHAAELDASIAYQLDVIGHPADRIYQEVAAPEAPVTTVVVVP